MSHSVTSRRSHKSNYTSNTNSSNSSTNFTSLLNTPKLCKCYALEPHEDCSGIPFGLDLMSKKTIKRMSTAKRDNKFQMNLISHTQRFGWGIPMKPLRENNDEDHSNSPNKSKRGKGKGKGKGKANRKQGPIIHRASSAEKYIHPAHGTLDSSAQVLLPPMEGEKNGPGDAEISWWEDQMSNQPKTPGTANAVVGGMSMNMNLNMNTMGVVDGEVVPFNNVEPLPGIDLAMNGMSDLDLMKPTSADLLIMDNDYRNNNNNNNYDNNDNNSNSDDAQSHTSELTTDMGVLGGMEVSERSERALKKMSTNHLKLTLFSISLARSPPHSITFVLLTRSPLLH